MAHLSVPSLCAVSCSPAAFQYLVTVAHDRGRLLTAWWKLCFLFHLFPWYPVLSPRDEPWQGWGLDLYQGICIALCLCTAGTLTAAHFNKGNCSVSVSRGARALKKGRIRIGHCSQMGTVPIWVSWEGELRWTVKEMLPVLLLTPLSITWLGLCCS